jgi:hypothetical protein
MVIVPGVVFSELSKHLTERTPERTLVTRRIRHFDFPWYTFVRRLAADARVERTGTSQAEAAGKTAPTDWILPSH